MTPPWRRWSASVMQRLTSWLPPRKPSPQANSAKPTIQLPGFSANWTHLTCRSRGHDGYWIKRTVRAGTFVLYVHDPTLQLTWYCQFLNPYDRRRYIDQLAGRRKTGTANAVIVRISPDGSPVL